MSENNVHRLDQFARRLEGDGQPPDNGVMEARIAKLEDFAMDTRERLARVETKIDTVAHDVGQFKWWIAGSAVAIILSMIAAVIGTGIGIQQMTVATFQGAAQVAKDAAPAAQPAPQPIIINIPPAVASPAAPASGAK